MKKINKQFVLRVILYLVGIVVTALGAVLIIRSELGAGGWDAVNANFAQLTGITIGQASMGINIFLLLFLILYRKDLKFLVVLFPILTMGSAIDFWDLIVFDSFAVNNITQKILTFAGGFVVLPFGLGLIIINKFPAMIFDELTLAFMDITKVNSFLKVRLGIEGFSIVLAITFGLLASIGLGAVSVGTFVISGAIGPLISISTNLLKRVFNFDNITKS